MEYTLEILHCEICRYTLPLTGNIKSPVLLDSIIQFRKALMWTTVSDKELNSIILMQ